MRSILLKITATLLAITSTAFGQARAWRVQSSCDGSFSVEVPSPLFKVSWFDGWGGAEMEPDADFNNDKTFYVTFQKVPRARNFGVVVFDHKGEDKKEAGEYKKGNFDGWYFMIGGNHAEATSEKLVQVNGLLGGEYVYTRAISEDRYVRGRIFTSTVVFTSSFLSLHRLKI